MVESQLLEDLKTIFKVQKVTYDQPSSVKEQEFLFVEIEQPKISYKKKSKRYTLTGKCTMFGQADKLRIGYFADHIYEAPKALHERFHFSEIDANTKYYQNLVQRDFSFVYFLTQQYDPDTGLITSVEFTTVEED